MDEAAPHIERALELGEQLRLSEVVVEALNTKGLLVQRRPNESLALMRQALVLAEETNNARGALRAYMNLSYLLLLAGKRAEAEAAIERGIELARRRGDRGWELALTANLVDSYYESGRWDEVEQVVASMPEEGRLTLDPVQASTMLFVRTMALVPRRARPGPGTRGRVCGLGRHGECGRSQRAHLGARPDRGGGGPVPRCFVGMP